MKIKQLFNSIRYSLRGIKYVFKNEQNFRIQLFVALLVVLLMFLFSLRRSEIVVLILLIVAVLTLEILNSALEKFIDLLKPRLAPQVKVVKDMMAAMVLITALGSAIIGVMIFWPHIIEILAK